VSAPIDESLPKSSLGKGSLNVINSVASENVISKSEGGFPLEDGFVSDAELEAKAEEVLARYPQQFAAKYSSAVMPLLYLVQERAGYISNKGVTWVADLLHTAPVRVLEIATFYTMYHRKPTGYYHIQLCRTLPCALVGAKDVGSYIKDRISKDNPLIEGRKLWSYEEVECLGSCGTAPLCQINDLYFEKLNTVKVKDLMNSLADTAHSIVANARLIGEELRLSSIQESFGNGILKFPPSQIR
jgi:NADH:ubiquinone oxidoreductase subunit E